MNELIIAVQTVNSEPRVDSREMAERLGVDAYTLLAGATQAALGGDHSRAIELVRVAREAATLEQQNNIAWLASSVMTDIAWALKAEGLENSTVSTHSEYGVVHFWFRNNFQHHIKKGVLEKVTKRQGLIPDFLVIVDSETRPVECKKTFNERSLNQLLTYMKAWDSQHGYAVGFQLTCELPQNITFICCPEPQSRQNLLLPAIASA